MLPQISIRTDATHRVMSVARTAAASAIDHAAGAEPVARAMQLMGATMSYPRNTEIFGENEPAE